MWVLDATYTQMYKCIHTHMQKWRAADRKKGGKITSNHLFVSTRDNLSVLFSIAIMKHLFSMPNKAYILDMKSQCASSNTEAIRI